MRTALSEGSSSFVAQAFHPNLGNEGVSGRIVLGTWAFRFESETLATEIRYNQLQIELPDADEERVCFRNAADPQWTICTPDTDILEHRALLAHTPTRQQIRALHGRGVVKRSVILTCIVLGSFALLATLGSLATSWMVRSVVARVPVEWEKKLGDALMAEFKTEKLLVQETRLQAHVNRMAAPLIEALPKDGTEFKLHVMENPLPNAFALPGGHMIVTTGLLGLADRPEEVLGVLAHEVAHVTKRHAIRHQIAAAGPALIFRVFLGGGGGFAGLLSGGSELLVERSFSQDYETEADDAAWDYLLAARIDPRGLADMLRKLQEAEERDRLLPIPQSFSTHPATSKRIKRLDAKWRKLKNPPEFIELPKLPPKS